MEQLGSQWVDFHEILYLRIFRNSVQKIQISLNRTRIVRTLYEDQHMFTSYLAEFFLEWKMVQARVAEKSKHAFYVQYFFFRKSCLLWDNVKKCCRAGQATNDNMAYAQCLMDTQGYKCTHRLCNTHCFSTLTMVARTHLNVTLYVHCLSCYY
jgi:hypothetical protein